MTNFVELRAQTFNQLIDNGSEDRKSKRYVTKRQLKFEYYKNCLEGAQLDNKINYLEINKIYIDSFY